MNGGRNMIELAHRFPHPSFKQSEAPCISIYLPTHKSASDSAQDRILFKNQLQTIEKSLRETLQKDEVAALLEPLYTLQQDRPFWDKSSAGLALFRDKNHCLMYRLRSDVEAQTHIDDKFYIKPLIRYFQTPENYHVLLISQSSFAFYTGHRDKAMRVEFPDDVPTTMRDIFGEERFEKHLNHAAYGNAGEAMVHGHHDKKDVFEKDLERYFNHVDAFVTEQFSKPTRVPLILWALSEHQPFFRKLSKNPFLLEEGVKRSVKGVNADDIAAKAWEIVETNVERNIAQLLDAYHAAKSKNKASSNIHEVAKYVAQNRVATIFIEAKRQVNGRLDKDSGRIVSTTSHDVLDDLAEAVFDTGGRVIVLPEKSMPATSGVAAIYRY